MFLQTVIFLYQDHDDKYKVRRFSQHVNWVLIRYLNQQYSKRLVEELIVYVDQSRISGKYSVKTANYHYLRNVSNENVDIISSYLLKNKWISSTSSSVSLSKLLFSVLVLHQGTWSRFDARETPTTKPFGLMPLPFSHKSRYRFLWK